MALELSIIWYPFWGYCFAEFNFINSDTINLGKTAAYTPKKMGERWKIGTHKRQVPGAVRWGKVPKPQNSKPNLT